MATMLLAVACAGCSFEAVGTGTLPWVASNEEALGPFPWVLEGRPFENVVDRIRVFAG